MTTSRLPIQETVEAMRRAALRSVTQLPIALVKSIGGITEGKLPGRPRFYRGLKVVVDIYNARETA